MPWSMSTLLIGEMRRIRKGHGGEASEPGGQSGESGVLEATGRRHFKEWPPSSYVAGRLNETVPGELTIGV